MPLIHYLSTVYVGTPSRSWTWPLHPHYIRNLTPRIVDKSWFIFEWAHEQRKWTASTNLLKKNLKTDLNKDNNRELWDELSCPSKRPHGWPPAKEPLSKVERARNTHNCFLKQWSIYIPSSLAWFPVHSKKGKGCLKHPVLLYIGIKMKNTFIWN